MNAKEIRNYIISLAILEVGVWLIANMSRSYESQAEIIGLPAGLTESVDSITTAFLYGIGALIVFLLILYFFARKAGNSSSRNNISRQPQEIR